MGGEIVDTVQNPQLAKVRADHRRWLASRLNRSKYGDKLDIQHNVTLDIAPVLLAATKKMKAVGVGNVIDVSADQLGEVDSDSM